jgi:signal transduction histidine kinase
VQRLALLGLRARIIVALALVSALTIAVTATALLAPLQDRLRQDRLSELASALSGAPLLLSRVPQDQLRAGSAALERTARALGRQTHAQVFILDDRLRMLATTDPDAREQPGDLRRALAGAHTVRSFAGAGDEEEARATVAITVRKRRFVVALHKTLDDVHAATAVISRAVLLAALIGLGTALVVGFAVASTIVRRLNQLRRTALEVARLGPVAEVMAPDAGRDEVGDLTRAFATMQARLREQEEARRTFVATASHELRTPLASLRLVLDLATQALEPHPAAADGLVQVERARAQAIRLGRLADELLQLSRIDASVTLRRDLVELVELCRAVVAEVAPAADDRGIDIALSASGEAWAVADPGAVARIVRILLENALDFSPPGRTVAVVASVGEAGAAVSVSDLGPGVPVDEREMIFERFRRGSRTVGEGGFGLGLAIARELAERMGGRVELLASGTGATFEVMLEAASPDQLDGVDPELL